MNIFLKITNIMFCWRHVWPCNQTTKHVDAIKSNHIIHIFSAARLRSRWNFCKPPMRWHLGPTIERRQGSIKESNNVECNKEFKRNMESTPNLFLCFLIVGVCAFMVALCFLCLKVWKCLEWFEKEARFAKVHRMIRSTRDIPHTVPHTIHVAYL